MKSLTLSWIHKEVLKNAICTWLDIFELVLKKPFQCSNMSSLWRYIRITFWCLMKKNLFTRRFFLMKTIRYDFIKGSTSSSLTTLHNKDRSFWSNSLSIYNLCKLLLLVLCNLSFVQSPLWCFTSDSKTQLSTKKKHLQMFSTSFV